MKFFFILLCAWKISSFENLNLISQSWRNLGWKQVTLHFPTSTQTQKNSKTILDWIKAGNKYGIQLISVNKLNCTITHGNLVIIGNGPETIDILRTMLMCKRYPGSILLVMRDTTMVSTMKSGIGTLGKTKSFFLLNGDGKISYLLAIQGQTALVENQWSCEFYPCKIPQENLNFHGARITGIVWFKFLSLSITNKMGLS